MPREPRTKAPWSPQNPVRHAELEELLAVFAQKLMDQIYSGNSRATVSPEEIARQTLDHVYRR